MFPGSSRIRAGTSRIVFTLAVITVLAATAAIVTTYHSGKTREQLRHLNDARIQVSMLHKSLAQSISEIVEYQEKGGIAERLRYLEQRRQLLQSIREVRSLSENTASHRTKNYVEDLSYAVEHWYRTVDRRGTLARRLERSEALKQIGDASAPLGHVHHIAASLQQSLERDRETRIESLETIEQTNIAILAVSGMAGLIVAWKSLQTAKHLERSSRQLRNAIRVRDETLRVLSHDLRNPLSNIMLAQTLLAAEPWGKDQPEHIRNVAIIDRAARLMDVLTRDFLDLARIESGQDLQLKYDAVDCCSLVNEVCDTFRMAAETRRIEVICDTKPAVVHADGARLRQVLMNLMDNALKFTPEGGSLVASCQSGRGEVIFRVSDTGPGIPASEQERVFEPFWHRSKSGASGTGLGLAIAKRIVEQHGGCIWLESSATAGATFAFTIPAEGEGTVPLMPAFV